MADAALTGHEVVKVSTDNSIDNTEPVAFRQLIAQIVGIIIAVLVYRGYVQPAEGAAIGAQSDIIVGAIMVLAGILGAVAGRMKAYAPKTAAQVAVDNAAAPAGTPPTLAPPP